MENSLHETIRDALEAHFRWRTQLRSAIEAGKSAISTEEARSCDQCTLGKWLADPEQRIAIAETTRYREIARLHREVHLAGARVVERIERGDLHGARGLLETLFTPQSEHLVAGLTKWLRDTHHRAAA